MRPALALHRGSCEEDAQDARGSILALPRLAARSGPLHPWSARSRLVEHSNPAHANPTAQVPAARRDDRPATRRRTTGRKHRFINRIRAPHNRYIATPKSARNGRPEELDRGYTPLRGLRRRRTDACAPHRRDGGPTPTRPKGAAMHDAQPNAYHLYNYTKPIFVLYMFMLYYFYTSKGYSVECGS